MAKSRNKTQVPRGYLSPSAIAMLMRSEKEWVDCYIYGKKLNFDGFRLGKLLSEVLDGKKKDSAAEWIKECIPSYPKREVEITCVLKRKGDSVKLLGKLDGWNARKGIQGEYKTDTTRWTLARAQKLLQLRIYALIHYKNTGKIPVQELTWVGTKRGANGKMYFTGEYQTIIIKHDLKTLLETEVEVWRAYDRIIALVERELDKIL